MSNKTQLQANNETLASILSKVLGLPTQESLKHGAYVWKKYDKCPQVTISFSGTIGSTEPVKVTVSSSQIDVSTLTESFFTGLSGKCSNRNGAFDFSFPSDGVISINNSSNNFVYNQSTHQIEIDGTPYITSFDDVIKEQESTFLDFVVSDSPTAYPDGGEQGGCWYEKVVEGIDLSALGWTKCAIDYITPSTNIYLKDSPLRHSLGVAPKYIHIKSFSDFTTSSYDLYLLEFVGCYSKDSSFHGGKSYCAHMSTADEFNAIFSADSKNIVISDTYLMQGIQYQIITIG